MTASALDVPSGVGIRRLTTHADPRGGFTELFRNEWETGVTPVQWNAVRSEAGVLRGVHCHPQHADALIVVGGSMRLGLVDLRPRAPTSGLACVLDLAGTGMDLVTIPPGVAHGFYFPEPALHVYAVDHVWNPADELGCRWDDPGLGLDWQIARAPLMSERDDRLGDLDALRRELAAV